MIGGSDLVIGPLCGASEQSGTPAQNKSESIWAVDCASKSLNQIAGGR